MHDQESNLTVWGLEPRCTSKDDHHPILRGIGHHHAMSLCRISLFGRHDAPPCNLDLTSIAKGFCPRCCVWRTSATRTFMGSDFLHSGTLVRTSQTQMVSQRLSAMKSFNTFSANSSCDRMDS